MNPAPYSWSFPSPLPMLSLISVRMSLGPIIEKITSGEMKPPYHLSKGVLCCKERRGRVPKVVLPSKLVPMVFQYYHDSPVGGHLGVSKTIAAI